MLMPPPLTESCPATVFPEIVDRINVKVPAFRMPPPKSLGPRAAFPATVLSVMVRVPLLKIPPPWEFSNPVPKVELFEMTQWLI